MHVKTVFAEQCVLGEGVYWHPTDGHLYWVDIGGHRIHRYHPDTGKTQVWQLNGLVSGICAMHHNHFIIGYEDKIARFEPKTGCVDVLWDSQSGLRMNDGLVGPGGRFWIGQVDDGGASKAKLFRFDPNGGCHVMETGLGISNGLDWDLDRQRFYLVDSSKRIIYVYDYDIETGNITNRQSFVTVSESDGYPDGMILDSTGHVWCCMWDGHKIMRFSPEGRLVQEVEMPVARPTKCAFGGKDLKTLYVTSASGNFNSGVELDAPAGYVFAIDVDVAGRPMNTFGDLSC